MDFFVVHEIFMKEYVIFEILSVYRKYAMAKIFKPRENFTNDSSKDALSNNMYISAGK